VELGAARGHGCRDDGSVPLAARLPGLAAGADALLLQRARREPSRGARSAGAEQAVKPAPPLLEVDALRVELPASEGPVRAVDGVSFTVGAGEVLGVVGQSGSGKSMTALALVGLLPEAARVSGRVVFEGEDLSAAGEARRARVRGDRIALVFQDALAALNPYLTVGEQLAEVLRTHRGAGRREAWARAVEMLDRVGIAAPARRAHDHPHQLSGGMRQRVLIAMALLCEPALIVADEPTSALDATVAAQILDIFREQREARGTSILLITHDLGVLAGLADRALVMHEGRVVEEGPVARLLAEPREEGTRELVEAVARVGAPVRGDGHAQ